MTQPRRSLLGLHHKWSTRAVPIIGNCASDSLHPSAWSITTVLSSPVEWNGVVECLYIRSETCFVSSAALPLQFSAARDAQEPVEPGKTRC